jgi:hypothetical protein
MMDNLDCFAFMLGGEKHAACMSFAISVGGSSNSVEPLAPEGLACENQAKRCN